MSHNPPRKGTSRSSFSLARQPGRRPASNEGRNEISLLHAIRVQTLGAVFCALVSFLLLAFLGRTLGPASFGDYVSLLSVAVIALILIEGGWPTLIYRDSVGTGPDGRVPRLTSHAVAHILSASVTLSALAIAVGGDHSLGLGAGLACMGLVALTNLVSARLRGLGAFTREALWQSLARMITAMLIVITVLGIGRSAVHVFSAWALGLVVVILLWGRRWIASPRWEGMRISYPLAIPFVAVEGLMALLLRGDIALLAALGLNGDSLSFYAACTRFTEAALLLFAPVSNVLLRNLRERYATPAAFARLWTGAAVGATTLGGIAILGSWWFGEALVTALFGDSYRPAAALLPYIAIALPFALVNLVLAPTLVALHRERWLARNLMIASIFLVAGLACGLHLDGARGAALGSAAAQIALLLLSLYAVRQPKVEKPCASL